MKPSTTLNKKMNDDQVHNSLYVILFFDIFKRIDVNKI